MAEPAAKPDLRLVDTTTGDSIESAYAGMGVGELVTLLERNERRSNGLELKVARLEKELDEGRVEAPATKNVREVLIYWRPRCMPRAEIVVGSPRWLKVKDRLGDVDVETGKRVFSVADLCVAVDGALMSDFHTGRDPKAGGKTYLDAKTIFKDPDKVQEHIARAVEGYDRAAVDFLRMPEGLALEHMVWLGQGCDGCGHSRVDHWAGTGGCSHIERPGEGCRCESFFGVHERVQRFREEERKLAEVAREGRNRQRSEEGVEPTLDEYRESEHKVRVQAAEAKERAMQGSLL